jgi:ribonuclease HI
MKKKYLKDSDILQILWAVIAGLEALKKSGLDVVIFSDSKYVVDAVEKGWIFDWVKKKFKGKKNADLWLKFLEHYKQNNIKFRWIKGHNNHPLNERCDRLAVAASEGKNLNIDSVYENQQE